MPAAFRPLLRSSTRADLSGVRGRVRAKRLFTVPRQAGHYVKGPGNSEDGSSDVYVHTPYDMEGHRGRDGRMYCIDFSRAFPPQPPSKASGT